MWKLIRTAIILAGISKLWKYKMVRKYAKQRLFRGLLPV